MHAAVNETVELVRTAGLERAVKFANAVMRRLALGLRELVEGLPEETPGAGGAAPLVSRLGRRGLVARPRRRAGARADARAERAARARRAAERAPARAGRRGEPDPAIPGALRVERIEDCNLAAGFAWPQSRGSQLAGLAVGAQPGERVLDLCAAPGGKATQLAESAEEVVAVEKHPGRARELEANCKLLGAANVRVINADAFSLPDDLRGFDRVLVDAPCSGLGVLAARPDLRWRGKPLPELQRDLLRVAAERVRPGGAIVYSVCTINADENEAIVDATGLEPDPLGEEWPQFAHAPGPSSCSRCRTATTRPGSSSPGCDHPPHELGRLDPDGRGRAVALRGRLLAPRRAGRGAAPRRVPRLPLRRRRRSLHPTRDDRADRAQVDRADRPPRWRRPRLPSDGRDPERHIQGFAEAGADSVTVHFEACPNLPDVVALAREHGLQVGLAFNPETDVDEAAHAAREAEVDLALCMSVHPGYSGQAFIPESLERVAKLRSLLPHSMHVQVDGGVGPDNIAELRDAGAELFVAATAIFGREDLPRAYRRLVQALA